MVRQDPCRGQCAVGVPGLRRVRGKRRGHGRRTAAPLSHHPSLKEFADSSKSARLISCPSLNALRAAADSAMHSGHTQSPAGTTTTGGSKQNMWQPRSQRSQRMICSSWWPPPQSSHTRVWMLCGTLIAPPRADGLLPRDLAYGNIHRLRCGTRAGGCLWTCRTAFERYSHRCVAKTAPARQ